MSVQQRAGSALVVIHTMDPSTNALRQFAELEAILAIYGQSAVSGTDHATTQALLDVSELGADAAAGRHASLIASTPLLFVVDVLSESLSADDDAAPGGDGRLAVHVEVPRGYPATGTVVARACCAGSVRAGAELTALLMARAAATPEEEVVYDLLCLARDWWDDGGTEAEGNEGNEGKEGGYGREEGRRRAEEGPAAAAAAVLEGAAASPSPSRSKGPATHVRRQRMYGGERAADAAPYEHMRVFFWAHHIRRKQVDMIELAKELELTGLITMGRPGFIFAEGPRLAVVEAIKRVKSWHWREVKLKWEETVRAPPKRAPPKRAPPPVATISHATTTFSDTSTSTPPRRVPCAPDDADAAGCAGAPIAPWAARVDLRLVDLDEMEIVPLDEFMNVFREAGRVDILEAGTGCPQT